MKSLGATFFVFLYVLAMLRPVMPLFEYVINQDYIAEFLCINKTKPTLNCNGKCYLTQKLNQQNEEKKQDLPRIAMEEYPIGFIKLITIVKPKKLIIPLENSFGYIENYHFFFSPNSFHPPNQIA